MRLLPAILIAALLSLAADPVTAGKYTGKWQGESGQAGDLVLKLAGGAGSWKAEVTFTLGDQNVPCKVSDLAVDGAKVHVVYTFDLLGTVLESTIDGERSGAKVSGKYRTRNVSDKSAVDQGT